MTGRQLKMLQLLWARQDAGLPCPSYREIGHEVGGISTCAVHNNVWSLVELGFVKRTPGKARGIELLRRPDGSDAHAEQVAIRALREIALFTTDKVAAERERLTLTLLGVPLEAPKLRVAA